MISASQICSVGSRRFGFHALHLKRSNCFSAFSVFSSIFFDIFFFRNKCDIVSASKHVVLQRGSHFSVLAVGKIESSITAT